MKARPCSKISKAWDVIHLRGLTLLSATGSPSTIGSAGSRGPSGTALDGGSGLLQSLLLFWDPLTTSRFLGHSVDRLG